MPVLQTFLNLMSSEYKDFGPLDLLYNQVIILDFELDKCSGVNDPF